MPTSTLLSALPRLIGIVVLCVASGFISASETALFALNRHQLLKLAESGGRAARAVLRLRDDPRGLLSTILLSNITVNMLLYSTLAVTVNRIAGSSGWLAAVLGVVGFVVILLAAEIVPKLIAMSASERLAILVAEPLLALKTSTRPVQWFFETVLVEPLTRLFSGTGSPGPTVKTDDLQALLDVARREGLIDDDEDTMLRRVTELATLRVSALMVPRVDVVAFDLSSPREALQNLIRKHRLLRIPVYRNSVDEIVGLVLAKEVLLERQRPIERLIRPIHFIPEQAGIDALLAHFRRTRSQVAFVVDEYGGLAGVIALEDVAEAVIGEMYSPGEAPLPPIQRIDDRAYSVDGSIDLAEFKDAFRIDLSDRRAQTIGGLVAVILDRVPVQEDTVPVDHLRVSVLEIHDRRVLRVRVETEQPIEPNATLNRLLESHRSRTVPVPARGGL